jgi:hypothetical protein
MSKQMAGQQRHLLPSQAGQGRQRERPLELGVFGDLCDFPLSVSTLTWLFSPYFLDLLTFVCQFMGNEGKANIYTGFLSLLFY